MKIRMKFLQKYVKEISLLVIGVILVLCSKIPSAEKNKNNLPIENINVSDSGKTDNLSIQEYYTTYYSTQIKSFLNEIDGVEDVSVMVYIDSIEDKTFAQNQENNQEKVIEKDSNGGERETENNKNVVEYVIIKDSQGNESMVITKNRIPKITGIAVRAKGADSYVIQEKIINAIKSTYGIESSQIYVCS